MTRFGRTLAGALALAAFASGCGGGSPSSTTTAASAVTTTSSATTTTTTASSHTRSATTTTTTSRTTSSSTTSSTAETATTTTTITTTTPTASTTTSTTTTRTETGPAFVGGGGSGTAALAAANAVLARDGFAAVSTATYGRADTLHVLIGRAAGSGERAFFFDEGRFIGTDSREPSARIVVVAHSDSVVTLAYDVYAAGAQSPTAQRRVSFALDMSQLSALGPLPSVAARR